MPDEIVLDIEDLPNFPPFTCSWQVAHLPQVSADWHLEPNITINTLTARLYLAHYHRANKSV